MMKVAFHGAAGSGKDYLAKLLGLRVVKFATPLYQSAAEITGLMVSELEALKEGRVWEVRHVLPPALAALPDEELTHRTRQLLQRLGTEVGRDSWYAGLWVDKWVGAVASLTHNQLTNTYRGIGVTDCRFPNEFDAARKLGFLMVHIDAPPDYLRIQPPTDNHTPFQGCCRYHHPSERSLDHYVADGRFDVYVINDRRGPPEVLRDHLLAAWERHVLRRMVREAM